MIVVRSEGVRGLDAVLPGQMPAGEIGGARGVLENIGIVKTDAIGREIKAPIVRPMIT